MARFTDLKGRTWELVLTLGNLPKLRAAGFNPSAAVRDADEFTKLDDPDTFGRVMWSLCEGQAGKSNIAPEDFAEGFDGATISDATDALMKALANFSQRPAVAKAIGEKLPGAMEKIEQAAISRLTGVLETTLNTGLKSGAGNSPASPASPAQT